MATTKTTKTKYLRNKRRDKRRRGSWDQCLGRVFRKRSMGRLRDRQRSWEERRIATMKYRTGDLIDPICVKVHALGFHAQIQLMILGEIMWGRRIGKSVYWISSWLRQLGCLWWTWQRVPWESMGRAARTLMKRGNDTSAGMIYIALHELGSKSSAYDYEQCGNVFKPCIDG